MTMLGRGAIIDRLREGQLVVSPLLSRNQVGAASIDLKMGTIVLMVRARGSSHVDPAKVQGMKGDWEHEHKRLSQQKHERYELPFGASLLLHPGALALVPTLEWVKVPEDLMGTVTARSTWAREGLSIATATLIEPGYQGIVTLELANLGQIPIALYPGLEIAQIAFAEVSKFRPRTDKPQFKGSFEPTQGSLAKPSEEPFFPDDVQHPKV